MSSPSLPRSLALAVVLAFSASTAGLGVLDGAWRTVHGSSADTPEAVVPQGWTAIRTGWWQRAIERNAVHGSRAGAWLRPIWSELLWRAVRDTDERVFAGRDGWLFLESTIRRPRGWERKQDASADWIGAAALALRARGVETLVAIVPDTVSVYPDRLPEWTLPPTERYGVLLERLAARGVHAPDLLEPLRSRRDVLLYRPDDTHWTLEGVDRAARVLAEHVAALAPGAGPPAEPIASWRDWAPSPGYQGDLVRGLGLRRGSSAWWALHFPEVGLQYDVPRTERPKELFLAGTSMSQKQLRESLSAGLAVEIGNYVEAGSGASAKLVEFARDRSGGRLPAARLIVWELVERYTRDGPAMAFPPILAVLPELWRDAYRPMIDLAPPQRSRRDLDTLLRPVHEGEEIPLRSDRWDVARFSGAFVLPANGTCALEWDPLEAAGGPLDVLLAPELPRRGWVDVPVHRVAPAAGQPARVALVGDGFVSSFELASRGGDALPAQGGARLVSAYAPLREISAGAWEQQDGVWRLALDLAGPVAADGVHALFMSVGASVDADASELSVAIDPAAPLRLALPATVEPVQVLVPLVLAPGHEVRRIELAVSGARAPRLVGPALWSARPH